MIDIRHLTFGYGEKTILRDISLTIKANSLTALIGLNGVGKSTLLGCLSKQKKISSGDVWVDGKNIKDYSFNEYAKIVSIVPQLSSIAQVDNKVRDFLVEGRTPYLPSFAVPGIKEYVFSEKIAVKIGVDKFLDTEFNKLSGGEQQLVLIARALVQDTPIILLDEPMSALDLKNQSFLLKIIKNLSKEGKTVLFSTHNPNHALSLACDVCIIHNRSILGLGNASDVLSTYAIKEIYGSDICVYEDEGMRRCEISEISD